MKSSFLIHVDSLAILDKITDEQAGILFKAIHYYQKHGSLPEMDLLIEIAITPFINQFARDEVKYQKIVERNHINGEKGGRPIKNQLHKPKKPNGLIGNPKEPNETQDNPEKPKKPVSDNDSDSVNDNDNKKDKIPFDEFWNLYDKKVGDRKKLQKKWDGFSKELQEQILIHVVAYKAATSDKQYMKNPEAYFNQKTWNDEIIHRTGTPSLVYSNGSRPYNQNEDLEVKRMEAARALQAMKAAEAYKSAAN
jgi:hypothetical protein